MNMSVKIEFDITFLTQIDLLGWPKRQKIAVYLMTSS